MTTQTATKIYSVIPRPAYTYSPTFDGKMIVWLKNILIRDGFLPEDLSVASGSAELQRVWLGLKNRHVKDVSHEVRVMWYHAIAMEQSITLAEATEQVENLIASWDTCTYLGEPETEAKPDLIESDLRLSPDEEVAARKLKKLAANSETAKQVLYYMLQNKPIHTAAFCKQAGIHTATMKATSQAIIKAAKCPKNSTIQEHLKRILKVKTTVYGGYAKTKMVDSQ